MIKRSTQMHAIKGTNTSHFEQTELSIVLDFCAQPIILVDYLFNIYYLNFRALSFFQQNEKELQKIIPNFTANLMHTHFNILEEKLSHRRYEVEHLELGERLSEIITLGNLTLELLITPTFDANYKRIGACIEVYDQTTLMQTISRLEEAIQAAAKGKFDKKIPKDLIADEYSPLKLIGEKINTLFETIHHFFSDISAALEHVVNGELDKNLVSYTINEDTQTHDFFAATRHDLNYTLNKIYTFVKNTKSHSKLMQAVIQKIIAKNSELAMTSERESIETDKIEENVQYFFEKLHANHLEIQQAIEVANSLSNNFSIVEDVRTVFQEVRKQLKTVLDATACMHYVLKGHLSQLKLAINEIQIGNIGRGITIVTTECEAMIRGTNELMNQIQTSATSVSRNLEEQNQSLDLMLDKISLNMTSMNDVIMLMSTILAEVQQSLTYQDNLFAEFNQSVHRLKNSHIDTVETIRNSVLLARVLVYISNELEDILDQFNMMRVETPDSEEEHIRNQKRIEELLKQHQQPIELKSQPVVKVFK